MGPATIVRNVHAVVVVNTCQRAATLRGRFATVGPAGGESSNYRGPSSRRGRLLDEYSASPHEDGIDVQDGIVRGPDSRVPFRVHVSRPVSTSVARRAVAEVDLLGWVVHEIPASKTRLRPPGLDVPAPSAGKAKGTHERPAGGAKSRGASAYGAASWGVRGGASHRGWFQALWKGRRPPDSGPATSQPKRQASSTKVRTRARRTARKGRRPVTSVTGREKQRTCVCGSSRYYFRVYGEVPAVPPVYVTTTLVPSAATEQPVTLFHLLTV